MADNIFYNEPEQAIVPSNSTQPATTSGFQKALPYLAMAIPAIISMQKTGKATPGLEFGSKLLSGVSAIQGMQRASAIEKDRDAMANMKIAAAQKEEAYQNEDINPFLTPVFLGLEPEQQDKMRPRIESHLGPSGLISRWRAKKLRQEFENDSVALEQHFKLGMVIKNQRADKLFKEAETEKLKNGETEKYRQKMKEYESATKIGVEYATSFDDHRKAAALRAKQSGATGNIVTWITPEGETVNLRKGEMPPKGSVKAPSRSIRESIGDTIDDAMIDFVADFKYREGREPNPTEMKALRLEAANTVKRQSPAKAGEVTAAQEEQKDLAKAFNIAMEEGIPAQGNKWRIQQAKKVIESGKAFTGKLSPIKKWVAEYYSAITGKTIEGLPESEMLTAIANRSALLLVGASQGKEGGMPANLFSEADREFVVASTFNPTQTDEGILKLMLISEKAEDYRIMKAKVFREYKKSHKGKLDSGVYDVIVKGMEKLYPTTQVNADIITTKSGRKARKNADGNYEYID